jgi:hypothetical protein
MKRLKNEVARFCDDACCIDLSMNTYCAKARDYSRESQRLRDVVKRMDDKVAIDHREA